MDRQESQQQSPGLDDLQDDSDTNAIDRVLARELQAIVVEPQAAPASDLPPQARAALARSKQAKARRARWRQEAPLGLICLALGTGSLLLFGLNIPTVYEFHQGWRWQAPQDSTIRHAYLQGQCNRQRGKRQKIACVKSQLREYVSPAATKKALLERERSAQ